MVEGTPLLREHTGQNLYPGFESLRLRQRDIEIAADGGHLLAVEQTGHKPKTFVHRAADPPSSLSFRSTARAASVPATRIT